MTDCHHRNLILIKPPTDKLRCTHCHLVLGKDELQRGYCPECLEVSGVKRCDFEEVIPQADTIRYRCEACGIIVECR